MSRLPVEAILDEFKIMRPNDHGEVTQHLCYLCRAHNKRIQTGQIVSLFFFF